MPQRFAMLSTVGGGGYPLDPPDEADAAWLLRAPGADDSRDVRYLFEVRNGVPRCVDVRVYVQPDYDGDVLRTDLQAVAPLQAADAARAFFNQNRTTFDGWTAPGPRDGRGDQRALTRARRQKITPDVLAEVAAVYAANFEGSPTKAVAEHFDIELRAASERVRRAHQEGYLKALKKGNAR